MNDTETIKVQVKVPVSITIEQISDLLCIAIEGGSNYWCDSITRIGGVTKEQAEFRHEVPFVEGGSLEVVENEDEGEGRVTLLNKEKLIDGLSVFAEKCPRQFSDLMADNSDAETGDCFLQCCCFGEVIYG